MASRAYLEAVRRVMAKPEGFRLSSLKGVDKAAAEKLIDRGKLYASRLPDGDFLVYRR